MRIPKKLIGKKEKNRGSALVLTVIVLINALVIVAAISAISVIERKASSRVKNSAPAFQAADSAMEWVLYMISSDDDPANHDLDDIFDSGGFTDLAGDPVAMDLNTGRYKCPDFLGVDCEFYFVDIFGEVIKDNTANFVEIDSARGVGRSGVAEEMATRALEVKLELRGPIAWWAFTEDDRDNGGPGDVADGDEVEDLTDHDNHATVNAGTWYVNDSECVDGADDTCIEFDGDSIGDPYDSNDNFAQAPDEPNNVYHITEGTVTLWFKTDDVSPDAQALWSKESTEEYENHLTITLANSNSYFVTQHGETCADATDGPDGFNTCGDEYIAIRLQEKDTADPDPEDGLNHIITGDDIIDADDWYFVAFTFGSNGMFLYVGKDGDAGTTLQADQEAYTGGLGSPPGVTNTENIQFGVDGVVKDNLGTDPLERPFDGYMDDIRMYDYEMDIVEIDNLFLDGPE